jgi:hypothetical protein
LALTILHSECLQLNFKNPPLGRVLVIEAVPELRPNDLTLEAVMIVAEHLASPAALVDSCQISRGTNDLRRRLQAALQPSIWCATTERSCASSARPTPSLA